MSTTTTIGLSFAAIEGEALAARAMARLHEHPDAICRAILEALEADMGGRALVPTTRLRSFCRQLQKALEQVRP